MSILRIGYQKQRSAESSRMGSFSQDTPQSSTAPFPAEPPNPSQVWLADLSLSHLQVSSFFPRLFFQSRSTSPEHQSFFSWVQLLCLQLRPQATKIWVSKHVFPAALQPSCFQQEPAARACSEQPAFSSPPQRFINRNNIVRRFRMREQTGFLDVT